MPSSSLFLPHLHPQFLLSFIIIILPFSYSFSYSHLRRRSGRRRTSLRWTTVNSMRQFVSHASERGANWQSKQTGEDGKEEEEELTNTIDREAALNEKKWERRRRHWPRQSPLNITECLLQPQPSVPPIVTDCADCSLDVNRATCLKSGNKFEH